MMKWILIFFPFFVLAQYGDNGPIRAFPSAEGGGASASGGRGGLLYIVDNLGISISDDVYHPSFCNTAGHAHQLPNINAEPYYTGGFFSGIVKSDVGHIVFNVSGNIEMGRGNGVTSGTGLLGYTDAFQGVRASNKTIYGQSAPQGGITFTGGTFRFGGRIDVSDGDNLVFRHIRSRPIYDRNGVRTVSDDAHTWALLIFGGDNVVVDHCSLSWAQDKAGGAFLNEQHVPVDNGGNASLNGHTWSRNIFADASTGGYVEINPDRPGDPQNFVDQISFVKNLFVGVNRTPNMAFDGQGEIINNVVYDTPTKNTSSYHDVSLNHLNNYYLSPDGNYEYSRAGQRDGADVPVVHSSGNYMIGTVNAAPDGAYVASVNFTGIEGVDNRELWVDYGQDNIISASYYTASKFNFSGWSNTVELNAEAAYADIVINGDVGANKYLDNSGNPQSYRDSFDASLISAVANNSGFTTNPSNWILPSIPSSTRPSVYDTDWDGMSDEWEIRVYGNLSQSYSGDWDGDGYQNIEEYMNQVDGATGSPGGGNSAPKDPTRTTSAMLIAH